MTDKPPLLTTQIAPPSQTVYFGQLLPTAAPPTLQKTETEEEEPYTIKCICNFTGDDGTTIYCETCETWQHIECYYPENVAAALRDDFQHSCVDCKPRPLDKHKAIERQRARLANVSLVKDESLENKKPRRPPSKSHKKKPKPNDLHLNGQSLAPGEGGKHPSPNDHHHPALPKKTKSSHKSHASLSSHSAKRSPSNGQPRPTQNGHPLSPADTLPDSLPNEWDLHGYSTGFQSLYNNIEDVASVGVNSFANLNISNMISRWLREPVTMRKDTGHDPTDVFVSPPSNIDSHKNDIQVAESHTIYKGLPLSWRYLKTAVAVGKDEPLLELNGQIGIQKEYCDDPTNRWAELTSPLPFVFFHPALPLYIDTRREGSRARYVRRSCRPNAVLESYLLGQSEYHFWIVSDRAIAANEQVTLPWDFRFPKQQNSRLMKLLGMLEDEGEVGSDIDDGELDTIREWLRLILSEYGGCACDLGSDCAFARFHRYYLNRIQVRLGAMKKRSRKPKTHTISPTSTGRATNSRAASEGRLDEVHENDGDSISGSGRSKPGSRDLTPARQGSFDTLGILTEPTDRDKRKVAMVEDSFRRMEQGHQAPPRKKKRTSDGPSGTGASSRTTAGPTGEPLSAVSRDERPQMRYVDAGTSRGQSVSPASATSATFHNVNGRHISPHAASQAVSRQVSLAPRTNYKDVSCQTDPVEGEWYSCSRSPTPAKRKRVVSLSRRLLSMRRDASSSIVERMVTPVIPTANMMSAGVMDVDGQSLPQASPTLILPLVTTTASLQINSTSPSVASSADTPMPDATAVWGTNNILAPSLSQSSTTSPTMSRSPELRVQLPPVPTFNSVGSASATTPLSATSPFAQSPFAVSGLPSPFGPPSVNGMVTTNPSPVKKKLSLSAYKDRLNKAAGRAPLGPGSLKQSASSADESNWPAIAEGGSVAESPIVEKTEGGATAVTPTAEMTNGNTT
jgi:uncharacterized protein